MLAQELKSKFEDRIGTPLLSYDEAIRIGAIEPGVRPLTDALNALGYEPIASCEGHVIPRRFLRQGWTEQNAFVLFRAPIEAAQSIARQMHYGRGTARTKLHFAWSLYAYFYPPTWTDLVWVIEPEDCRIPNEWDRRKVNRDFLGLAEMVKNIG